eukprot:CAMPEP_0182924810 /NCGR_PEP_ID=MMETSP0105_2-20130417/7529_1 /TAXON_ID=81532 ORGANISM="Acanthoeca-like sp., Strain 10tr" /NCGR_SAMPLE_ID=MMETSP0105_2 /ASSEMBLY_ACC=CAM_ASM_000205 /LENGTH=304 /DNA_ID=CAMNT_0025062619 /DNA_START=41 /DNA_END=955 /DNA_ORIENTATION=+
MSAEDAPKAEEAAAAPAEAPVPDVVKRLTDHTKYTGTHAERFNDDGTGKGKAGREDIFSNDGSTNARERMSKSDKKHSRKEVVERKWDGRKFTTQADMPRRIKVFGFGNHNDPGTIVVLNLSVKSIDQVLGKVPNLPTGRPKKLIQQDLKTRVKNLDGFRDGGHYLAVPTPSFKVSGPDHFGIPKAFEYIERKKSLVFDKKKALSMWPGLKLSEIKKCAEQFEVYDKDGNNLIDINEITAALVTLGFDVSEEKVEDFIEEFDVDKNHALDFYEFCGVVNKAKTEPGSENLLVQGVGGSALCSIQ